MKQNTVTKPIAYENMFWLFMIGSVLGVILEGIWCLIRTGHWETHVVSMWGVQTLFLVYMWL